MSRSECTSVPPELRARRLMPTSSRAFPEHNASWHTVCVNPRVFLDVDPRTLRLPGSRRSGTDPVKLHRQLAQFGTSTQGMPPLEVSRGTDGELVINNGVTRATRIA